MNASIQQFSEVSSVYVPKQDLYGMPHKGIRLVFGRALERLGSADLGDEAVRREVLASVEETLWLQEQHIEHEEQFIHTALEARRPGSAAKLDHEHEHITVLEVPLAELADALAAGRIDDMKTLALVQALRLAEPSLFEG